MPRARYQTCLHLVSVRTSPSGVPNLPLTMPISGTFALRFLLPDQVSQEGQLKRVRLAIYLITVATVVFRSELALLLASHSLYLLLKASGEGLQSQIALIR